MENPSFTVIPTLVSDIGITTLPLISVNNVSVIEGLNPLANFTVTLEAPVNNEVSVSYATANGTAIDNLDYTTNTGTLTFAPGETSKTISVSILNDTISEPTETFTLNLSNPTAGILQNAVGTGTITDDDLLININNVSVIEGLNPLANFTVTLAAPLSNPVSVDYATAPGTATASSDYTTNSGTLTFAPGETSKTISVSILNDTISEPTETFTLNLSNPTAGILQNAVGTGTITDDDFVYPRRRVDFNRLNFRSSNQRITTTSIPNFNHDRFLGLSWNTGNREAALRVLGLRAGLRGSTSGQVGVQSRLNVSAGQLNSAHLPIDLWLDVPSNVRPGDLVTVRSGFRLNNSANYDVSFPGGSYDLDGIFNLRANAQAFLGGSSANLLNVNTNLRRDIINFGFNPRATDNAGDGVLGSQVRTNLFNQTLLDLDRIFTSATGIPLNGETFIGINLGWFLGRIGLTARYNLLDAGINGGISWRNNFGLSVDNLTGQLLLEDGTRHNFTVGRDFTFTAPANFGDSLDLSANLNLGASLRHRGSLEYNVSAYLKALGASVSVRPGGSLGFGPLVNTSQTLLRGDIPIYDQTLSLGGISSPTINYSIPVGV